MTDLPRDLEQAPAGTRELSDAVLLALGWRQSGTEYAPVWSKSYGEPSLGIFWRDADPARSVDDGLAAALRELREDAMRRVALAGQTVTLDWLDAVLADAPDAEDKS